ncbi:LCP family protein [Rothia nasimurium]|uniref:LCP family protein n=1 Tax=Rothia nasimurium TaxID=85336 RepID=UPI001F3A7746|nr:LCP family protein [Rothia nasimurium]
MHRDSSSPQGTSAPAASEQPIVGRRARGEKVSPPVLTDPLNHPESASPRLRARRAWSLLALSLLLPGSAQLVQGNRTLGRRALAVTGLVWALVLALLALWFLNRSWVLTLATHSWSLWIATLAFAALALGWVFILLDTYRLMKPGLLTGRSKPLVSLALIAALFITGGGLGYAAYITWVGRGALSSIFAGGTPLQEQDGRYNILLMGGDAGEDRVGRRPDSMTVVSIDATTGQAITISVPRNLQNAIFETGSPLWSIYPEGFNCGDECILNALYPTVSRDYPDLYPEADDPGAEATMDAVSGVLGITVENYILIDMSGFEQLIDALGGITIDVGGRVPIGGGTNEFTGLPNPIDGYIEPGRQHLDGFHALWYARSREGATDYDRQARQRCVQAAMLKQLDPANVLTKFADITAAGEQVIETNIPQGGLASLGNVALKSKNYALIQFAAGPPYFGEMFPTYPDFDLLHQRVQQVIADSAQGIQPEATPLASSTGQQQPAGGVIIVTVSQKTLLAAETDPATGLSENGTCSVP